jgi:hypothetical protein
MWICPHLSNHHRAGQFSHLPSRQSLQLHNALLFFVLDLNLVLTSTTTPTPVLPWVA